MAILLSKARACEHVKNVREGGSEHVKNEREGMRERERERERERRTGRSGDLD